MAVVVVFERDLVAVDAWPTLCVMLQANNEHAALCLERVLIYDNSPSSRTQGAKASPKCEQFHDPCNGGTAAAYRYAAARAKELSLEWLLLLDQDTSLPTDYLIRASAKLLSLSEPEMPAALLPWVLQGVEVVSPSSVDSIGGIQPLLRDRPLHGQRLMTGIASGSLVHCESLAQIFPPPPKLWLDYLDHWMFVSWQASGMKLSVFDAELSHHLSNSSVGSLSPRRLESILAGEREWLKLLPTAARAAYPFRLLLRALRYAAVDRSPAHSAIVTRAACRYVLRRSGV
jgi:hypothetical protein